MLPSTLLYIYFTTLCFFADSPVTVVTVIGAKVTKGSSSWQKEEGSVKSSRPHEGE